MDYTREGKDLQSTVTCIVDTHGNTPIYPVHYMLGKLFHPFQWDGISSGLVHEWSSNMLDKGVSCFGVRGAIGVD